MSGFLGSLINVTVNAFDTQMSNLNQQLGLIVKALGSISISTQPAVYTTATGLPVPTAANIGNLAFVANGRNNGQGVGAGTGCLCQVQIISGVATWCAVWSGLAVTV